MSEQQSRETMTRYFEAMGRDEDLTPFLTDDVSWLMVDSGELVTGPAAVYDYMMRLHARMTGQQQRDFVVTDGHAYLEAYDVNGPGGLAYCLVYDLTEDRISAMRCYGTLATLMPVS
jgi:hypothetical protein